MSPLHFRLAVGLANAVDGAALQVRLCDGGAIVASSYRWSALTLADLRNALIAPGHPAGPDQRMDDASIERRVAEVDVTGALVHLGGGLHLLEEFDENTPPTLWFAVPLSPRMTAVVLAEAGIDEELDDDAEIILRNDPALGVTVIGVQADGEDEVFELALRCHAACLIAELEALTLSSTSRGDTGE